MFNHRERMILEGEPMEIDHKEFEQSIKVRPLRIEDLNDIVEMQLQCFPTMEPSTKEETR